MPGSAALALLLTSLVFSTVSARFFTLRLSLPSSYDHSSFSLCINQIGSSECSLFSSTQIPLDGSTIEMEFVSNTTRSSIQQHISFTSSIISSNFSNPLRHHSSHRLSINQVKILRIAPGLSVNASLHCQHNYFGAACSIRCVSTDRINCDRSGRPSCANGWTGEGCATRISSTVVSSIVPSTTVTPSATSSSEVVIVETRPLPDHTQLLIVLCMVLTVMTCVVVLYSMYQMSSVVSTRAAPDRLTTHLTTLDSTMENDDSSELFKAACNHVQSMQDLMVRSDSDSVLDSSFVSALDEKTYVEMYP
ncbi:hypothetical protein PRIPAC_77459 [Pristionchus pacificus]|uniref:DSL domain-containing protein n=1 Tax=Pristionchus pacificus TaxID=54126 RepID=A0A454XQV9_PRIPA|nr:hypothetical protein PRIPAC_77459 [Pristionchus pacificus]|eukprot:PDM72964.1 hypothetical protein PRIPAC_39398 [Pristionchus pacificus]